MGKEDQERVQEVKECCNARSVLWYLVFVGFAVNYMIRINLNIAIVAMVQTKPSDNISLTSECLRTESLPTVLDSGGNKSVLNDLLKTSPYHNSSFRGILPNSTSRYSTAQFLNTSLKLGDSDISLLQRDSKLGNKFAWDEKIQGYILGSFFWLHWTTQIPGGMLANKYGTKKVFGLSNFAAVILCNFIPYFARMGAMHLILLRLVQGALVGFAWPSVHDMTARWIPPNERSKFVTAYLGSSVGTALTYPVCGFIIDKWGWEYVFYASSAFGTVWFVIWWLLVHDSPAQHPRISQHEKEYILRTLGQTVSKKKAPVPWSDILRNRTVWMNVLAQWGGLWGLFTLMTQAPTYFKFIHGWNIRATGVLSGLPHLLRMLWAYIFSLIGDFLLRTDMMTRSNVRKLATAICCIGQGVFMMALAYSGCDSKAAIVFLTFAVAISGSVSTGTLASVVDLSPNYAAILMGFLNTAGAIVGFFTPAVVGFLTYQNEEGTAMGNCLSPFLANLFMGRFESEIKEEFEYFPKQTTTQWQKVFWVSSAWLFSSGILYVIFAKSELQPWNSPEKKRPAEEELMVIKLQKEGKEVSEN